MNMGNRQLEVGRDVYARLLRYVVAVFFVVTAANSGSAQIALPASGYIETVASGSAEGPGVAVDSSGNVYMAETYSMSFGKQKICSV
jgi:hypothetical protein